MERLMVAILTRIGISRALSRRFRNRSAAGDEHWLGSARQSDITSSSARISPSSLRHLTHNIPSGARNVSKPKGSSVGAERSGGLLLLTAVSLGSIDASRT